MEWVRQALHSPEGSADEGLASVPLPQPLGLPPAGERGAGSMRWRAGCAGRAELLTQVHRGCGVHEERGHGAAGRFIPTPLHLSFNVEISCVSCAWKDRPCD